MDWLALVERFGLPLVMLAGLVYMTFIKRILIPGWYLAEADENWRARLEQERAQYDAEMARERESRERERVRADKATEQLWNLIATSKGLVSIAQEARQDAPRA